MKTIEHHRNIHEVRQEIGRGGSFEMLHTSDWHYDNPHCMRDLLHSHLDEAKEKGALVCCYGDLFCAMQGKYDRRSSKNDLRPEHKVTHYLDALVETTAEALKPWHDNLFVLGLGNHETGILKNHETNLIDRLVQLIRHMTPSSPVVAGGYGGWLKVTADRKGSGSSVSNVLKYFHGSGGGGPVTKGAIQQQRHAVMYEGADIIYSGHIHEAQSTEFVKESFNPQKNTTRQTVQQHIRGATYKEEYQDGYAGFHVERGAAPKPLGGWWVEYSFAGKDATVLHGTAYRTRQ